MNLTIIDIIVKVIMGYSFICAVLFCVMIEYWYRDERSHFEPPPNWAKCLVKPGAIFFIFSFLSFGFIRMLWWFPGKWGYYNEYSEVFTPYKIAIAIILSIVVTVWLWKVVFRVYARYLNAEKWKNQGERWEEEKELRRLIREGETDKYD